MQGTPGGVPCLFFTAHPEALAMSDDALLRSSLTSVEVNDTFTEAVIRMKDRSRLLFRHRVGERWAKAEGAEGTESDACLAGQVLAHVVLFRLNAKHLDIQFKDGSRWEAQFGNSRRE
jgi:hypothetical protein